MSPPDDRTRRDRRVWWGLLAVASALHLAIALLTPVSGDEAYYWDWSRQLDWGYYSKPPMIAWLIAASTSLIGSTTLAVRLPAVLLGTVGLIFVYLLASRLYGGKAGFWASPESAMTCVTCPAISSISPV